MTFTIIVIPCVGRPYVALDGIKNNEYDYLKNIYGNEPSEAIYFSDRVGYIIHPLFTQSHKRWEIVHSLFMKYGKQPKNMLMFVPENGIAFSPNPAVIELYIKEKQIRPIMGDVCMKIRTKTLKKVCKDYEEIFKKEDDDEEDDEED